MIIKPLYTSESLKPRELDESDKLIIEDILDRYSSDVIFESLNEERYGEPSFAYTGGARVKGVDGARQSIPSLLLTAIISWPVALFSALGALSHRIMKKFEDKNSWMNRLDPRFWGEYLATHKDDKNEPWFNRVKDKVAGNDKDNKDSSSNVEQNEKSNENLTKDDVVNAAFVEYWVTLSNGEIIRLRSDSDENAKLMANTIISYTTKTCYEKFNRNIKDLNMPRYKFFFDDGEICYWSAPTEKEAKKQAIESRTSLCDTMNRMMSGIAVLEKLDKPRVIGKPEIVYNEPVPVPVKDKFLNITTTKPVFNINGEKILPNPVYKYSTLNNYRLIYAYFAFNFPAVNDDDAKDIAKRILEMREIDDIEHNFERSLPVFRVKMNDGDIYYIAADSETSAKSYAKDIYDSKVRILKTVLVDSPLEEYERFLEDFGQMVAGYKNVMAIDDSKVKPKKEEPKMTKIITKELPEDKIVYKKLSEY